MKSVDATLPRITNDGLALILSGKTFAEARHQHPGGHLQPADLPTEMDALAQTLLAKSRLLALPSASSQATIYNASGHDLALLGRYRDACRACVAAAVRARAAPGAKDAQAFLERIVAEVAPVPHNPTLALGPAALELDTAKALNQLQSQFRTDVETLKANVAMWFNQLAERDHVSLIEWFNEAALRYHFFRMDVLRQELDRQVQRSGNVIDGVTTTTSTKTRVQVFNERRTHTVVRARTYRPDTYCARVPKRIAVLLDNIPGELRPFVSIIDGQVTHEEVHRRLTSDKVEVETHSVYRPDPAVALFNTWAIGGWGGSTPEASRSVYQAHPLSNVNKFLIGSLLASVTAAAAVAPIFSLGASAAIAVAGIVVTGVSQIGMRRKIARKQEAR